MCSLASLITRPKARRAGSLVLAISRPASGGPIMAAPSAVFTIARVAEMLGEDEDWFSDVALEMDPEAGRITIYGVNDEGTTGSTSFGIENLKELIEIQKADPTIIENYRNWTDLCGPADPRCSSQAYPLSPVRHVQSRSPARWRRLSAGTRQGAKRGWATSVPLIRANRSPVALPSAACADLPAASAGSLRARRTRGRADSRKSSPALRRSLHHSACQTTRRSARGCRQGGRCRRPPTAPGYGRATKPCPRSRKCARNCQRRPDPRSRGWSGRLPAPPLPFDGRSREG